MMPRVSPSGSGRLAAAFGALAIAACASSSQPAVSTQAFVEAAPDEIVPERTMAVSVTQSAGVCDDDSSCAQVEAIRAVLFTGVPGSAVPRAMIRRQGDAWRDHEDVLNALLEGNGHRTYVVRSEVVSSRDGQDVWIVVVNHDALRIHLEEEGVIRKFGLGDME